MTPGTDAPAPPGILAIFNDRTDAIAEVYERWYRTEHVPERLSVPGFLAARRYEAETVSPRFFTCYEVAGVDVLSSPEYLARLASPSPLTREVMAHFRNMVRTVCVPVYRSHGDARGGCIAVAYVEQPTPVDVSAWLAAAARAEREPGVLGVQVWRAAQDGTHAATTEADLRPGGDRRIEVALVADVMRESDGRAQEASLRAALGAAVAGEARRDEPRLRCNVYRLLGEWQAPTG